MRSLTIILLLIALFPLGCPDGNNPVDPIPCMIVLVNESDYPIAMELEPIDPAGPRVPFAWALPHSEDGNECEPGLYDAWIYSTAGASHTPLVIGVRAHDEFTARVVVVNEMLIPTED